MAIVNGYATVQHLRDELGDSASKVPPSLLERAIHAASRGLDDVCDRRFWKDATPAVRTYRPAWSTREYPYGTVAVDDIATTTGLIVKTDPSLNGSFTDTWTLGTDFRLEPRNADRSDGQAYAWWRIVALGTKTLPAHAARDTVQVTATFGWSAIPEQITAACIIKAAQLFKRKDAPFGVAGVSEFGIVRISRNDPDVSALIDKFVWDADMGIA